MSQGETIAPWAEEVVGVLSYQAPAGGITYGSHKHDYEYQQLVVGIITVIMAVVCPISRRHAIYISLIECLHLDLYS